MIRKLTESDRQNVIKYLKQEPEINLFILGDIENYGFQTDSQDIWADISENDEYQAVLLRYYNSYILYTHNSNNYDYSNFANQIKTAIASKIADTISAKKEIMDKLYPLLETKEDFSRKSCYFSKCNRIDPAFPVSNLDKVKYATTDHIEEIAEFMNEKIVEFGTLRNLDSMRKAIETGSGSIVYMKDTKTNKPIATASTAAENTYSAMIVGVATDPDYRNKGYASACVYKLTKKLIDEGRTACLFYDNPKAGNIYKKLGFVDIDKWDMVNKKD